MADIICRWRNGTPGTVVELVKALPHSVMSINDFRSYMESNWKDDFFRSASQLACQLALYYESKDGKYYPRFDHDISEGEAIKYLESWISRYYIPNPYVGHDGFNDLKCPTYLLKSLYDYVSDHPGCYYATAYKQCFNDEAKNNDDIVRNYINRYSKVMSFSKEGILTITGSYNTQHLDKIMERSSKKDFFNNFNQADQPSLMDSYLSKNVEQRKQMFYDYLKSTGLAESSCKQYVTYPSREEVIAVIQENASKNCLYDVIDGWMVKRIHKIVCGLDGNKKQNNAWSASIYNYKNFLDYLEVGVEDDVEIKHKKVVEAPIDHFKHLLEYFCAHLSYIVTNDKSVKGYDTYLKKYVDNGTFKISGHGYKGDNIQKQIEAWEKYDYGRVCINVYGSSFQSYATYLHWEGTSHNISLNWDGDTISSLQLVEYIEKPKSKWVPTNIKYTLDELGLFDGKDANPTVKSFYEEFAAMLSKKVSIPQIPFDINDLIKAILSTNLIYSDNLIKRLAYSLMTKPFVILSGLAGSGKTQLALALAKALVEDEEKQMCVVSVGADWTNREPLLGFPNALQPGKYERPESGVLDLLIECNKEENKDKPYFLILDEMNLSYVERYFADFLSAMESHEDIKLWKNPDEEKDKTPNYVSLTKNLFIIGTINVDETTYMFSPKVLDRANVIEFKVSEDDMDTFLDAAPNVDISKCNGLAANMAADFVNIASSNKDMSNVANETLKKFFKNLKAANAEFGYRTATEIGRFISLASEDMTEDEAVDAAIVQKLLPKLHGSRKKIIPVLEELWKLCGCDDLKELESPDASVAKYNLTADKVLRMYNVALDNGFASFAEA